MGILVKDNCFNIIPRLTQGSIDMILTDPPYEISNSGGGMMDRGNRKFIREIDGMGMCQSGFDVDDFLTQTIPLFKDKHHYCGVFFCSVKQLHSYINWAINNKMQYGVGVWHKTNPAPLCNNKYLGDLEYWVYIKGSKSRIRGEYKTKSLMYQSPINKKDKDLYGHPTIKPLDLMEKFVINHTDEGNVVFDPFMGTGTTGVACKNTNRQFLGVELDEKYYNIANQRINGNTT